MNGRDGFSGLIGFAAVWFLICPCTGMPPKEPFLETGGRSYTVSEGNLAISIEEPALEKLGLAFVSLGERESNERGTYFVFDAQPSSTLTLRLRDDRFESIVAGRLVTRGALLLDRSGERMVIGNLSLNVGSDGVITVNNTLQDRESPPDAVFECTSALVQFNATDRHLQVLAELSVTPSWARKLGKTDAAGLVMGRARLDATLSPAIRGPADRTAPLADGSLNAGNAVSQRGTTGVLGPDVIVSDLQSTIRYATLGDVTPYGIGTTACNEGTQRADWISYTNQHPVILQNLYRLKNDKFEQIGMSWIKHGFYAVSESLCRPCLDPTDGSQLGIGCSDPYSASLNAVQTNMSPRSTVNAHTGFFIYPWSGPTPTDSIARRLQAHSIDLYPPVNLGAKYFIEGHYVHPGDAAAGTHDNNASYREITINSSLDLLISPSSQTQRMQPAVRAWQDVDPGVTETDIRVPGEGLFILAGKAIDLGSGIWRYSYALENLNSDRSARSFAVPIPLGAVVTNIGFHNPEYHSAEVYDPAPWQSVVSDQFVSWSTLTYAENYNANALRFSTAYSFYFDVNAGPATGIITIGLFKPGTPTDVTGATVVPDPALADCNHNGVRDACDLDCLAPGCTQPCGGSADCNANAIPDECDAPPPPNADPSGLAQTRFLSFSVASCLESALRVRLIALHHVVPPYTGGAGSAFALFEGQSMFVGPPVQYVEAASNGIPFYAAQMQCSPYYQDWSTVGLLRLTGEIIVPSSSYRVESLAARCAGNEATCTAVSSAIEIQTTRWGDVETPYQDPVGPLVTQPDTSDISSLVNKFKSALGAPAKARALLAGSTNRGTLSGADIAADVGFTHISQCVDAFKGLPYPYRPGKCTGDAAKACAADADCTAESVAGPCILCP